MSDELKTISVKQIRGLSGSRELLRKSVKGLGLKKINLVVDVIVTPANRGMINNVKHLVEIIEN